MAHLNVTFFARDPANATGFGQENSTGDMVVVKNGTVIGRWRSTGLDEQQPGEVRGDFMRYGLTGWEGSHAKTVGQIVLGDGNDVVSKAMSQDATIDADGKVSVSGLFRIRGVTTDTTAGAYTYLVAGMQLGLYLRDPSGADRADVTDTAANIIAAISGSVVGSFIDFAIVNTADADETMTLTAGANVTLSPTVPKISRGQAVLFRAVKTGAATVTIYQMTSRLARGNILVGDSDGQVRTLPAATAAQLVAGDTNDVKSMPMTNDVTLAHSGGNLVSTLAAQYRARDVTADATAGVYTYLIAGMKLGLYLRDPNGGDRSDVTDTAANIIAGLLSAVATSFVDFTIVNTADAEETITLTAGAGVTLSPATIEIARGQAASFRAIMTGAGAVTISQLSSRLARGRILVGGTNGEPKALAASANAQILIGDGNDLKSVAVTGDISIDNAGLTAIGANKVLDSMISSEIVKDLGNQCVGWVDSTGVGSDTETVTTGARVYELDTHGAPGVITPGNVRVNVSGGSTVKSQGTLTLNSQPLNTETVTIDGKVYTFEAALTEVDGHVHISHVDSSGTIDNLIAAINLGAGGGTDYASATTLHPTVSAGVGAGDTMIVTAKAGGVGGDAIPLADGLSDGASVWDHDHLGTTRAGVSPTATEVAAALAAAINADASRVTDAIDNADGTVLLVGKAAGATNHALAETAANMVVSAAACVGGEAASVKSIHTIRRVITAADELVLNDVNGTISLGGIPSTTEPLYYIINVRTGGGVPKVCVGTAFSWFQANANFWVLRAVDGGGVPEMTSGDIVTVLVIE